MDYRDLISLNKSFQYSINLQYDIDNLEKVKGYIPTKQSVSILKEYLKNILLDTNEKSTVLIGPYGKGKSHLALVLVSIIACSDKGLVNDLVKKIKLIDEETSEMIKAIKKSNDKFLPLIINTNSYDLNQAFLISINETIKKYSLEDIEINTYFSSVISLINLWKENYKSTLNVLEEELKKYNITLNEFIKELNNYSSEAYKLFINIYPMISSGVEYNPMVNTDVIKIIEEFNYKICEEKGYKGIFIIFDEFSKFIEASSDKNNAKDMKLLQDLAELCNRTKDNQIHLLCITHKSINEYISKIPANKIDMWRAIEGRFKEIYFTTSSKQNYELIGNTIISDKIKIEEIIDNNKNLTKIYERCYEIFKDLYDFKSYKQNIAVNTFPLNPITVFILPIISEKVAQNERTLFTFLSKRGANTLNGFLSKGKFLDLLEIDIIYNYFEELFRKEIFNDKVRDIWIKSDLALKKANSIEEEKIIKGLSLIKISDREEILPPTKESLKSAFSNINVEEILDSLLKRGILMNRKSTNSLDFMPGINIDLKQKIKDVINTKFGSVDLAYELEKIDNRGYITAKKYNDEYNMTRFFKDKFISLEEFLTYDDLEKLVYKENSDGLILNILEEDEVNLQKFLENIDTYDKVKNLILNVPNRKIDFKEDVLELLSVKFLKKDVDLLKENELLNEYLNILEEDLLQDIKNKVNKLFDVEKDNSKLYWQGKKLDIHSLGGLNRKISEICQLLYGATPNINNEMINKRKISSVILKARNKIIDGIFMNNIDFIGKGPEVTIARATLINKGIFSEKHIDKDIDLVLKVLEKEVINFEGKKKGFDVIYRILEGNSHGFGIRRGVIPIYLALVLSKFKDEIILYKGERSLREVPLKTETLNAINEEPNMYFLELDKGTREKEEYFNNLDKLFNSSIARGNNRYERLVEAMQDWLKSLDKYTRIHEEKFNSSEKIDSDIIKLRKELLKYDINIRNFIFTQVPKICGEENYNFVYERLKNIKKYLDERANNIKIILINLTKDKFYKSYEGSLGQAVKVWFNNLNEYKKDYLYDVVTNKLISYAKNLDSNNEEVIIDDISIILTGLTISDWNDDTLKVYMETLNNSLEKINDLEEIKNKDNSDFITLVSKNNGEKSEKIFKKTEISVLGSTLINQLEETIDEYGSSINEDEKRTILIELLEKFI